MEKKLKWIDLASKVINNPFKRYNCPSCPEGVLTICITPWPKPIEKVDVKLACSTCKDFNVITKNIEME